MVGSSYPGAEEGPKGLAVRQLKSYVSWVQTVLKLNSDLAVVQFEPASRDLKYFRL